MLILISNVIVLSQWKNIILKNFSNLTLIVTHDENASKYKSRNWMFVVVMKNVSQSLRHWSAKLQYIFNDSMRAVFRIVILSIYDTFIARILIKTSIEKDDEEKKSQILYFSKWKKVFRVMIVNENHRLKHSWTKSHHAMRTLETNVHWFLIAIFVINNSVVSDLHIQMKIFDLTSFRI